MHLTNSAVNKLNITGCVHAGICQPMKWSLSGLKYVLVDLIFLPLENCSGRHCGTRLHTPGKLIQLPDLPVTAFRPSRQRLAQ